MKIRTTEHETLMGFTEIEGIKATLAGLAAVEVAMHSEDYWNPEQDHILDRNRAVCRVRDLKIEVGHLLFKATDPDRDVRAGNIDGTLGEISISDTQDELNFMQKGARLLLDNEFDVQAKVSPVYMRDVSDVEPHLRELLEVEVKH